MADENVIAEEVKQEVVEQPNPFVDGAWKTQPTAVVPSPDPVIKEKDDKIKEEKPTSTKPDEPEKIPGASPKPVQDRPDDVKEDVKPAAAAEPLKFANEESEKIFNLIKDGKEDEVYTYLQEKKTFSKLDTMDAADVIKLDLKYQNKDFSPEEINDLFSDTYAKPEKPEQMDIESDEDFATRTAKYDKEVAKVEARIKRDAKPAKTELLRIQKEIVLPDIQKEAPAPAGPTQEELDGIAKARENYLKAVDGGVQSFSGYEATYKDEEVEIKAAYKPTTEQKAQMKTLLENFNMDAYFEKRWIAADGSFNTKQLAEDIHLLENRDSIFQKFVSEVGNKRHEASIKSIKNIDYSGVKKSNGEVGATPEQLQNQMATHFFSH